ncbi:MULTISPECIES: TonB-dependent receptor [unclassified Lysobacter]|uniref:TonB-dependent receptor domain-containing protein n=1 Tax=unclassified Lysobacter TaxID=2635362 RepID=UPI0006FECC40|nr:MULTISPECIES: TonB-dependent receptor [unclassified Lysobacter]KQZ60261.1 TonB-dependent receptor [Lysobacter sp. Root559]KRC38703.1 TonB-dependent receptor [Lysobacter sp. Root76]KRD71094.1 TonB-dependent receptor [Lysobacter sp. Root96]
MTLKTTQLRDAITFALAVGATAAAGTGVAFAQETEKEATTLDRIEVTGSRIKRTDIETSQPVFSLSRDDIQAQGLTSVGDVIQNITANGSTLNSTFNNGGNGETRVSLRNLGSNRTLVLVNGRRWVGGTGLGGAVDLNTIPTAAVERIEVLKDGASTIYGSDAIAGVVNVILRQNYEGAEANAYLGTYSDGDGFREAYDFTVGAASDRWTAMFGVGYVKEEPVMAGDRKISKEPVAGTGNAFGSSTVPNGRFALCGGTYDPATGTCSVGETRPNGTAGQFTYNDGQSGLNWRNRTGADIYNFAPDNYLLTPQERKSLFAAGSLDITDNLRFKTTLTYNNRKSEQLLAAMPIVLGSGPGANAQSKQLTISAQSIYNPFGQTVSRIQRRAIEAGFRTFEQDVDTFAANFGLEGTLNVGSKPFDWEAGYFYGENKQNNVTEGLFNVLALRNALGPSFRDANGVARCGTPTAVITGCVPLNLLGAVGTITPEMLAYSTFVAHDQLGYKQKSYYANIGGDLFDLPGGPLAFSFGLEHRSENGFSQPDALIASGNTTGNATAPTAGGYSLDEAYLELAVPVLADMPFAKLLDFSVATRYSDYSNVGDTLNSKFGFRWKPIDDLMIRGNWSEGFRAPSIGELFTGIGDSFPTIADPCALAGFGNLAPDAQARCIAQGVPAGGYDQGNPQIRINSGGNPNLKPESSESTTLGFVYSPSWIEGFDVSLDWWKIEIDNALTLPTGQFIVDECIVGNVQFYCNMFTRNPGGSLNLTAQPGNVGGITTEGYDLTIGYKLPENSWGKFSFSWDTTYLAKSDFDLDGDGRFNERKNDVPAVGAPVATWGIDESNNAPGLYAQNSNAWRIRSNLAMRWEKGDFGATWNVRYFSGQEEDCQTFVDYGYSFLCSDPNRFTAEPQDTNGNGVWDGTGAGGDTLVSVQHARNHIGATTYHDASVFWNTPWNSKVTIGVNNLFDKDPPRSVSAFANSFDPQYEVPGRFIYFRYAQKF